jgi:hypothetical protein
VQKRLGHANPSITLSIYTHALEVDELAAAKVWEDAMAEVIEAQRKNSGPAGVSHNVTPKAHKLQLIR